MPRSLVAPLLALLALALSALPAPAAPAPTTIRIRPVVAAPDGAPVVDRAWLEAQVERANAIFAPYALRFALDPTEALADPVDALVRSDRDALAKHVAPKVLNLFVVRRLMDIHEEGRVRRGVHWKARHGGRRVHYVIMASYAFEGILAHELAHFFGNPKHRHVPGNLVGYVPGIGLPTLDPDQVANLRRALRRMLRSGELAPAEPASSTGR